MATVAANWARAEAIAFRSRSSSRIAKSILGKAYKTKLYKEERKERKGILPGLLKESTEMYQGDGLQNEI